MPIFESGIFELFSCVELLLGIADEAGFVAPFFGIRMAGSCKLIRPNDLPFVLVGCT